MEGRQQWWSATVKNEQFWIWPLQKWSTVGWGFSVVSGTVRRTGLVNIRKSPLCLWKSRLSKAGNWKSLACFWVYERPVRQQFFRDYWSEPGKYRRGSLFWGKASNMRSLLPKSRCLRWCYRLVSVGDDMLLFRCRIYKGIRSQASLFLPLPEELFMCN